MVYLTEPIETTNKENPVKFDEFSNLWFDIMRFCFTRYAVYEAINNNSLHWPFVPVIFLIEFVFAFILYTMLILYVIVLIVLFVVSFILGVLLFIVLNIITCFIPTIYIWYTFKNKDTQLEV